MESRSPPRSPPELGGSRTEPEDTVFFLIQNQQKTHIFLCAVTVHQKNFRLRRYFPLYSHSTIRKFRLRRYFPPSSIRKISPAALIPPIQSKTYCNSTSENFRLRRYFPLYNYHNFFRMRCYINPEFYYPSELSRLPPELGGSSRISTACSPPKVPPELGGSSWDFAPP